MLEARDRVGGRVHTVEHEGRVLELGAQWLHGACHSNNLFNFSLRHNLLGEQVRTLRQSVKKLNGIFEFSTLSVFLY